MADLGDSNGFDNGFEKLPTAAELSGSSYYVQDVGVAPASPKKEDNSGSPCTKESVDPLVLDLIYWRDMKKTGIVFGSALVLLLSLALFSLLSVIAYLSLVTLIVTTSYRIYKNIYAAVQKTGEGHPFQHFLDIDISLRTNTVYRFADDVAVYGLSAINELRRLFLVEDMVDSLKFGLLLWILTYIGAWFNGLTLVIIATSMLFSGPITYEMYKVEIDQLIDMVNNTMSSGWTKIRAKLPGLLKKKQA